MHVSGEQASLFHTTLEKNCAGNGPQVMYQEMANLSLNKEHTLQNDMKT